MSRATVDAEDWLPTRKTLVSRLRNVDDQESWRDFFETYWKLIYSFALKCGCTDTEAEEAVQETVIAIARKMPEFKYDPAVCSFKGWLLHVANCRVIDQLRKRNHRILQPVDEPGTSGTAALAQIPDPLGLHMERLWAEEWERNLMDAAMERVKRRCNPAHYQIFHLLAVKNLSVSEITEALGVNRGQVYLAKHRVGALVRRELKHLDQKML